MASTAALLHRRAFTARAKTRAQTSRAARRAHGAQVPTGPMLAYAGALARALQPMHEEIRGRLSLDVLKDFSTAHNTGVQKFDERARAKIFLPGIIGERVSELRVHLQATGPTVIHTVDEAGKRISTFNAREMKRVIGIDPFKDQGLGASLDGWRKENVRLITGMSDDLLSQIEETLADNFGLRAEDLAELIEKRIGVSESRANLIARDQTLKLNGNLTRVRQVNAGVDEYIWTTSNDERVREEHASKEGQRFRWDTPPPETGAPGEDINCRCTAYPVIPELDGEAEDDD